MFRIGEFSRLSRLSIKALRFYDERGLLKPTYVDQTTGYRYYSAALLPRLQRILAFKELGFSLEEIIDLLGGDPQVDRVQTLLRSKREELSKKLEREKSRLVAVDSWLSQIEQTGAVPEYEIVLKQVAPRLVASVRDSLAAYADAEELFNELRRYLKRQGAALERGAIWRSCAAMRQSIDCEAVIFLREPATGNERIQVYELPELFVASITHLGSDGDSEQAYCAARSWIKSQGYMRAGAPREIYWQGGVEENDESAVTEIQYPVIPPLSDGSAEH
jgi:DNA-binding transcriptional MerR regulator